MITRERARFRLTRRRAHRRIRFFRAGGLPRDDKEILG